MTNRSFISYFKFFMKNLLNFGQLDNVVNMETCGLLEFDDNT